MEVLQASLYDHPKYYDLLFGSDWKAEFDFLEACFRRYAARQVRRVFEPACGTGRLLARFAAAGYQVSGNDLNAQAVAYCNARLRRRGFPPTATVGDMADFRLPIEVDAAFNTVSSFQHLTSEEAAHCHLRCVARALAVGGLYVLGFYLTPEKHDEPHEERWSARRGNLSVRSHMRAIHVDRRRRRERVVMTVDVDTPRKRFRLADEMVFRTYTAVQARRLLDRVGRLECVATYDFAYDVDRPVCVDANTEDVVYVLRKR